MRNKSTENLLLDLDKKVEDIMEEFADYIDGTRVLLLLQRAKEGGDNKEHKRRRARFVTHNVEQFKRSLFELLLLQATISPDYRIYLSSAPRDVRRAEMEFKRTMLEVDFADGDGKKFFYQHIEDKWISALMSTNPEKGRGLFILDIDTPDNGDALIWCAANEVEVLKQYKTKNGWHMIVKPFNRTLFPKDLGEVKDDGLLLLAY
jgi:hypothetical protein